MSARIEGKIKLAIIGCGGIAHAHANGLNALRDRIECVALCDIASSNIDLLSERLGGVNSRYVCWKQMLAEIGDHIDAVDICLPHDLHAQCILDAVKAGKHIICEKPMCISLKEGAEILKAVDQSGITYMSAHNQLFMPSVQKARELLAEGAIGKLYMIRSQDCFRAGNGEDAFKDAWRADVKRQGGGELIDTGYHPTYRLLYLAGAPVVSVHGMMARFLQHIGGEDSASVQVLFENGIMGEILTSWAFDLPYGVYQIHLLGSEGQIFGSGDELYLLRRGEVTPTKISLPATDCFMAQLEHFADCLNQGKRPIHSAKEGLEVLEVILKAAENAGEWETYAHVQIKK